MNTVDGAFIPQPFQYCPCNRGRTRQAALRYLSKGRKADVQIDWKISTSSLLIGP